MTEVKKIDLSAIKKATNTPKEETKSSPVCSSEAQTEIQQIEENKKSEDDQTNVLVEEALQTRKKISIHSIKTYTKDNSSTQKQEEKEGETTQIAKTQKQQNTQNTENKVTKIQIHENNESQTIEIIDLGKENLYEDNLGEIFQNYSSDFTEKKKQQAEKDSNNEISGKNTVKATESKKDPVKKSGNRINSKEKDETKKTSNKVLDTTEKTNHIDQKTDVKDADKEIQNKKQESVSENTSIATSKEDQEAEGLKTYFKKKEKRKKKLMLLPPLLVTLFFLLGILFHIIPEGGTLGKYKTSIIDMIPKKEVTWIVDEINVEGHVFPILSGTGIYGEIKGKKVYKYNEVTYNTKQSLVNELEKYLKKGKPEEKEGTKETNNNVETIDTTDENNGETNIENEKTIINTEKDKKEKLKNALLKSFR